MRYKRSGGITRSEKILADLCDHSFLTLWSYPNLFRKPGKELCDLLVVFGDDVIIFSDKSCAYPDTGDTNLDWARWYRRSIKKSAQTIARAESWLKRCPERVFLDTKCTSVIPVQIPNSKRLKVHRVCVALGSSSRCRAETNKPTLALSTNVVDAARPFTIGRVSGLNGWTHIFDENTLHVVLRELSTASDFLRYLREKEALLDSEAVISADSELDLLAFFLWNGRQIPAPSARYVKLENDLWSKVEADPSFLAGREENKVSRLWDGLIEYVTDHCVNRTLEFGNEMPMAHHERLMRIMARENRFGRRLLSKWILERAEIAAGKYVGSLFPSLQSDVLYVLLVGPGSKADVHSEYRRGRFDQLYARCIAAKSARPNRRYIVGIAMDAGGVGGGSEDFIYMDTGDWSEDAYRKAEELRHKLGYFVEGSMKEHRVTESEYPGA